MCNKKHFIYKLAQVDKSNSSRTVFITSVRLQTGMYNIASNYKVFAYIVRHNYVLDGMLFTICKAQVHVSAINVGHLQVVQ